MNLGKEDERQEFIRKPGQLNKGLRSLTAMLNRQTEGTVYLGVKKDGTVKGLKTGKSGRMKRGALFSGLTRKVRIFRMPVTEDIIFGQLRRMRGWTGNCCEKCCFRAVRIGLSGWKQRIR